MNTITEQNSPIQVKGNYDVIVAGGGPAGFSAAVASALSGAKTLLIERLGALGGVWTNSLVSWVHDGHTKLGPIRKVTQMLDERDARRFRVEGGTGFACDPEEMKHALEKLCVSVGVDLRYHTQIVNAKVLDGEISHIITESKAGREAWAAKTFVDATGDGDLAYVAGCGYSLGDESGKCQPLSLLATVTGVHFNDIEEFVGGGLAEPKKRLLEEMEEAGVHPTYGAPTLFMVRPDFFLLMANHQYNVLCDDPDAITDATVEARSEVFTLVDGLRKKGGVWKNMRIVSTANQIGIREGRRINGLYTVSLEDMIEGKKHEDSVCRVTFGIDVHSIDPSHGKGCNEKGEKVKTKDYDIPLRSLISQDYTNLLTAGRCISGDFYAHSSYRVTGNACAMGEAAGTAAALSGRSKKRVSEVPFGEVQEQIEHNRERLS